MNRFAARRSRTARSCAGLIFFQVLLLQTLCAAGYSQAEERSSVYWGDARTRDGVLLYREKHITTYKGDRLLQSVTLYQDPEGREIARMVSDYTRSLMMPTYVFEDYRRGSREGLRFENGAYFIFHDEPGRGEVVKPLGESDQVFSCQGWHYYLVENLKKLENDEPLRLKLILPNKLRAYAFQLERVQSEGENIRVRLRVANRLVSWFAPHLELLYNRQNRKLIEYTGVSNILDERGELQEVFIRYSDS